MTNEYNKRNQAATKADQDREFIYTMGQTPHDVIDDGTVGGTPAVTQLYHTLVIEEEASVTYTNNLGGYSASGETIAAGSIRYGRFSAVSAASGKVIGYRII